METRKLSLVYAIAGFIYTGFLFFIFLWLFGIYDLAEFFNGIRTYLPYISVIIFFLAYVMGIISEPILQKLIFKKRKETFNAEKQISRLAEWPEALRNNISVSFDKLVILRHFIVGPILLSISLLLWILCSDFQHKVNLIFVVLASGSSLAILSTIAYRIRCNVHRQLEKAVDNYLKKRKV